MEKHCFSWTNTFTTGATLACCAERLWEAAPSKIIKMACVDRGYLKQKSAVATRPCRGGALIHRGVRRCDSAPNLSRASQKRAVFSP